MQVVAANHADPGGAGRAGDGVRRVPPGRPCAKAGRRHATARHAIREPNRAEATDKLDHETETHGDRPGDGDALM